MVFFFFFFSSRRRHTRFKCDWSSDVCSSDLDAESRCPPGPENRVIKGGEVHAQRGRGNAPGVVRFNDAAVDPLGEAEVVGVDDEAAPGRHGLDSSMTTGAASSARMPGFVYSGTTSPWRASPN